MPPLLDLDLPGELCCMEVSMIHGINSESSIQPSLNLLQSKSSNDRSWLSFPGYLLIEYSPNGDAVVTPNGLVRCSALATPVVK